jgi:N-acetylneuraminic acid mutarotase
MVVKSCLLSVYCFGVVVLILAVADYYNDFYSYDPKSNTWTAINAAGSVPSPRHMHSLAATPDGLLYLFSGFILAYIQDGQFWGGK